MPFFFLRIALATVLLAAFPYFRVLVFFRVAIVPPRPLEEKSWDEVVYRAASKLSIHSTDYTSYPNGGFHFMRADILPGAKFPDYELTDHAAKRRKLSELQGPDPMILVLSRGQFCPKDRRQMENLNELHREIEVGYCRLVTISTDNLLDTNHFRTGVGAHWPFLADPGRKIQKDLDICEYTDPDYNPMIPYTFVLEPGLVIYKIYCGYWFFARPTNEELRHDLRAVLKKCRTDWDIETPEMKAAWARGDKSRFYPYDKTYAQVFSEQT